MARTIRLDQIGRYVEGRMDQLLRVAVLETDSRLKQASPVDTGRFRASWQVGENSALGGVKPPGDYGSGGIPPIERIGYSQEKVGNVYSVHNNLPYAEPLANGSSKKAQAGWVQGIAKDIQGFVRTNAAKIGRES
jgi:hypothetical protein